jgi:protein-S-isoprenylcysteine O-methyltransferase Ste14
MTKLATFAIYAGIVVFALVFVLVVVPWLSRATGATPEMVSIVTAALSFVVALSSYMTVRAMSAKKAPVETNKE